MKLTAHTFVTLDGVMQGPGGPDEDTTGGFTAGGWVVPLVDEDFGRIVDGWFSQADEILLGRTTYDMMSAFWSQITDPDDNVGRALNTLPKHVASTTLTDPTWQNTSVIAADVVDAVRALKDQPGRELQVHGSCALLHTLHDAGLIDEYRLMSSRSCSARASASSPRGRRPRGSRSSRAGSPAPAPCTRCCVPRRSRRATSSSRTAVR